MAGLREIRRRIKSVREIAKITRAMKMVAAAKLRRAEREVASYAPFMEALEDVKRSLCCLSELEGHPLCRVNEKGLRCLVVVTGDKGLCGAYNTNIIRQAVDILAEQPNTSVFAIGTKGASYFKRHGTPMVGELTGLSQEMLYARVRQVADELGHNYANGSFKEISVIYSLYEGMSLKIIVEKLLPYERHTGAEEEGDMWYVFEPEGLVDELLWEYLRRRLYWIVLRADATEHRARMMAMDNASNNAEQLIEDLTLEYNRERQWAITSELLDIVGSAEALRSEQMG